MAYAMKKTLINTEGFTLVDVLLAVLVVGILTAGYLLVLKPVTGSAKVSAAVGSIGSLEKEVILYASHDGGNVGTASINTLINDDDLGSNWQYNASCTPTSTSSNIAHCNPWGYPYAIAGISADVFTISLNGVPENSAYQIASQLWNSADNSDSGYGTGTIFTTSTGTVIPLIPNMTANSTGVGILTVYFSI